MENIWSAVSDITSKAPPQSAGGLKTRLTADSSRLDEFMRGWRNYSKKNI